MKFTTQLSQIFLIFFKKISTINCPNQYFISGQSLFIGCVKYIFISFWVFFHIQLSSNKLWEFIWQVSMWSTINLPHLIFVDVSISIEVEPLESRYNSRKHVLSEVVFGDTQHVSNELRLLDPAITWIVPDFFTRFLPLYFLLQYPG